MFFTRLVPVFAVLALIAALRVPANAQGDPAVNKKKTLELIERANEEYRVFFKQPEKTLEYWAAITFELDLGKFDLAALHLKRMLGKDPTPGLKFDTPDELDKALVNLEEAEGLSAFLRLERVRKWSEHPPFHKEATENVDELIKRVTSSVEKYLGDPVRIKKYIAQLDARTPEERGYALIQIMRSRERAVPYLVETLRVGFGKSIYGRAREMLLRMGPETVPLYLEMFRAVDHKDAGSADLRLALLDIIQERDDKRVIPYLWHMSAAKQYPENVRRKAKEMLASMHRVAPDDLPGAKETLTLMAERYYQHKISFGDKAIKIWEWDGQSIKPPVELTPYYAEEFYADRYARQALDLDPTYQPAQIVLLSLMLERSYRPKMQKILTEPLPPKLQHLLTTIDADLMVRIMERAMEERQLPVVLPLLKALGERGEFRAARANAGDSPRGILRALYYPDRRVQFAGLEAMMHMPPSTIPAVAADRIVDLSRRFLASEFKSKALIAYAPVGQEVELRKTAKDLGFEPELARKASDLFDEKGRTKAPFNTADFDVVILHRGMADRDFPYAYTQIRKEFDLGGLPMIVVVEKAREKAVRKYVGRDPNVIVVAEDNFKADDEFKGIVEKLVKDFQITTLSQDERKYFSKVSMDRLWRMARGEIQGYDVTPALDVIKTHIRSPEYSTQALEILGRMPGRTIQAQLASLVGSPNEDIKTMRLPAVLELNRHMQKYGVQVDKNQLDNLKRARDAAKDTPFGRELNVTVSMFARTNPRLTGTDILRFRPDVAPPPPPKE